MDDQNPNIVALEKIVEAMGQQITAEEVAQAFEKVIEIINENQSQVEDSILFSFQELEKRIGKLVIELNEVIDKKSPADDLAKLKQELLSAVNEAKEIAELRYTKEEIIREVLGQLPKPKEAKPVTPDTPEEVITKVNISKKKIKKSQIEGFEDLERKVIQNNHALPITTMFVNGMRAKNIQFSGATVVQNGDTAFVTITGGGGGVVSSVFGRTGDVVAQSGDYTTDLVTEASNLYFTNERAQDAVGSILTDSSTIDLVYNDGANTISASAIYQLSITADASGLKLSGDSASPGNNKYYGTDGSGTKGFFSLGTGSGTVTDVSVVSANGFAGSVANSTTTPAITLSTTITGLLKGNGTAISAAVAGTDYQTPISGTVNRISISGGNTIDISASYVGQNTITTLGTIGTGIWQGTKIGLAYGGTNADLSATGGTSQYLKQSSAGAAITVGTIPASDIASGAALTRVNDTNVTLTLGGAPTTALLAATSLTLGWSGQLAETRGGTNQSTYATGDTLYASAANTLSKLSGNTTTTKKFLSQTGNGSASAAPVWDFIGSGISAPNGFLINGKITSSVASNNLTVAIKGKDGNDPSATNPVYIQLGDTQYTLTSALSVTKNAGTNWFGSGSSETATLDIDYFVYIGRNATDGITIGFARIPWATKYGDFSTTSTNNNYCAISTITNAASTDPYAVIGRFNAILSATASFNWSIGTSLIINNPIFETRWLSWTPTYSASGSMTYTSVATSFAKYRIMGTTLFWSITSAGTTGGSASTELYFTLPFSVADANASISSGYVNDGGAKSGWFYLSAVNQVGVDKYDSTNWGLGGNRQIHNGAFANIA